MKTSERGIRLIKDHEGFSPKAYLCPAGKLTVGYGTTTGVRAGMTVTKEEAHTLLQRDLRRFEAAVTKMVTVHLSQEQYDAIISLVYNVGEDKFRTSTLLKRLNEGKYRDAAVQFSKWVYAGKKKLPGLVTRRKAEKELFLEGTEAEPFKPLPKTRTMAGAGAAAATGVTAIGLGVADQIAQVAPAVTVAREVAETANNHPSGLLIVFGLVVIAAALFIAWARIDDRRKGLR